MSDFIDYPLGTRIMIKSTGEHGEAFESALGTISVFIDGEDKCRYFSLVDVIFL
jgi:hypothetical protein